MIDSCWDESATLWISWYRSAAILGFVFLVRDSLLLVVFARMFSLSSSFAKFSRLAFWKKYLNPGMIVRLTFAVLDIRSPHILFWGGVAF